MVLSAKQIEDLLSIHNNSYEPRSVNVLILYQLGLIRIKDDKIIVSDKGSDYIKKLLITPFQ